MEADEAPAPALRYALRRAGCEDFSVDAPRASLHRVRAPDAEAKARLVAALLEVRCTGGERLELFGAEVAALDRAARARLQERIGVLAPAVGLISNLNAWENISLPAAYNGAPPIDEVANTTLAALAALGVEPQALLARLPHELGAYETKLVAFVRLLAGRPELALFDDLEAGLTRDERERAARFAHAYRERHPSGTLILVELTGGTP